MERMLGSNDVAEVLCFCRHIGKVDQGGKGNRLQAHQR